MTLITIREASERLGIALPTAFRLAHAGRFPLPLEGDWPRWRVQAGDVDAFLAGRTPTPAADQLEALLDHLDAGRARRQALLDQLRAERPARRPALTLIPGAAG